jgi:pyruvate carboxylase
MSGVCIEIRVTSGQTIKAGDPVSTFWWTRFSFDKTFSYTLSQVAVLSAMKLESVITSPVAGVVSEVVVKPNDSLSQGDLIAVITHE